MRFFKVEVIILLYCYYVQVVQSESTEEFGISALRDESPSKPPLSPKYKPTKTPKKGSWLERGNWTGTTCDKDGTNMKHFVPTSKYFFNLDHNSFKDQTPGVIIEGCKHHGLIALEIRHYDDYLSVQKLYRKVEGLGKATYSPMGISDLKDKGEWKYMNGDKVAFTAWINTQPDNNQGAERCADVSIHPKFGSNLFWSDIKCDGPKLWHKYAQICQFPKRHACFVKSEEEEDNRLRSDKLFLVGETKTRKLFTSYQQKTMHDADKFCRSNGYNLFDFSEYPNDHKMEQMYGLHKVNLDKLDLGSWTYFWTSAVLKNQKKPKDGWTWLSTNQTYKYPKTDKSIKLRLTLESPADKLNRIEGECLVYSWKVENDEQAKYILLIRPIKCNIPFFFYCYKELSKSNKNEPEIQPVETTTPGLKAKSVLSESGEESLSPEPEEESVSSKPDGESVSPKPDGESVSPKPDGESASPEPKEKSVSPEPEKESASLEPEQKSQPEETDSKSKSRAERFEQWQWQVIAV